MCTFKDNNDKAYKSNLIRGDYCIGKKVRQYIIANVSRLPKSIIKSVEIQLKDLNKTYCSLNCNYGIIYSYDPTG